MTLEEELEIENQKKIAANDKIKQIRRDIALSKVKVGAAYSAGNIIYVPRDVDIDMKYNIDRLICSSINSLVNGSCKIERSWIHPDGFSEYEMINENGDEAIMNEARKALKSHENT